MKHNETILKFPVSDKEKFEQVYLPQWKESIRAAGLEKIIDIALSEKDGQMQVIIEIQADQLEPEARHALKLLSISLFSPDDTLKPKWTVPSIETSKPQETPRLKIWSDAELRPGGSRLKPKSSEPDLPGH